MDTIVQGITIGGQYKKGRFHNKKGRKRTTETDRARVRAKHESA